MTRIFLGGMTKHEFKRQREAPPTQAHGGATCHRHPPKPRWRKMRDYKSESGQQITAKGKSWRLVRRGDHGGFPERIMRHGQHEDARSCHERLDGALQNYGPLR